jgi:ribonuclease J
MKLERLDWPDDLLVSPPQAKTLPRSSVVWAATGTQGEPRGALRRLASRQHPDLTLQPGDVVALSSRVIPGNERAVSALMDDLAAQGATVLSRLTNPDIHVSGHAHRDEQRSLLEWISPRAFVPLHGTRMHLLAHAELARDTGVDQVQVLLNGEALRVGREHLTHEGRVVAGKVAVARGVELSDEVLRERRTLGRSGVVFVSLQRIAEQPRLSSVHLVGLPDDAEARATRVVLRVLNDAKRTRSDAAIAEDVRRALRSEMLELNGSKPAVDVKWARDIGG